MSTKSELETTVERIRDEKDWSDGDFEIITADNVRFRIPSFYLYSASSVFRDAHGAADGSERKVVLTDRVCEIAAVFRLFLRLVVQGRLVVSRQLPFVKELAIFLDKYGCDQPRSLMCAKIENAVRRGEVDALAAFLVAANVRDLTFIRLILTLHAQDTWPSFQGGQASNTVGGAVGKSVWDSNFWPPSTWTSGVPQMYLFALARAYGDTTIDHTNPLADNFERYIRLVPDGDDEANVNDT